MGFRNGVLGSLGFPKLERAAGAANSSSERCRGISEAGSGAGATVAAEEPQQPRCCHAGVLGVPALALASPALPWPALPCAALPCPACLALPCPALTALPCLPCLSKCGATFLPCPALPFRNCAQWGHILQQQGPCQTRSQTSTSERRAL